MEKFHSFLSETKTLIGYYLQFAGNLAHIRKNKTKKIIISLALLGFSFVSNIKITSILRKFFVLNSSIIILNFLNCQGHILLSVTVIASAGR